MSNDGNDKLVRQDAHRYPSVLDHLNEEDRQLALKKIADSDIELLHTMRDRANRSTTAERDIGTALDTINVLQDERKVYTQKFQGTTGSGSYELKVRGGDSKFIVTLALSVIGVIAAIALLISVL